MSFILGLLSVTAVIASILLAIVILLQEPKGGGIAAALGGAGMEAVGVNTGSVNKFTSWVATIWVLSCFLHAILMPSDATIGAELNGGDTAADTSTDGGDPGGGGGGATPAGGGEKEE